VRRRSPAVPEPETYAKTQRRKKTERFFGALVVTLSLGCAAAAPPRSSTPLHITLKHGTDDELATKKQLEAILARYDVSSFMSTTAIEIDRDAIPHSHPVLTLHTRHLHDDLLLLSTLVHEEGHWYLEQNAAKTDVAVAELKALFPELPVGFPEGANDLRSSYEHLVVISLEQQGMRALVGELATRQVMEFWANDHYRALYRIVMTDGRKISEVMERAGLFERGADGRYVHALGVSSGAAHIEALDGLVIDVDALWAELDRLAE
jgi:hypothetical protein